MNFKELKKEYSLLKESKGFLNLNSLRRRTRFKKELKKKINELIIIIESLDKASKISNDIIKARKVFNNELNDLMVIKETF